MSANDVVAIQQLLNRYCHKLDGGEVDAVVALFTDDAVLIPEYEGSGEHAGRDAVRAWYSNYSRGTTAAVTGLRHKISTAMIDVDGNSATSVCYLDADSNRRTNRRTVAGRRPLRRQIGEIKRRMAPVRTTHHRRLRLFDSGTIATSLRRRGNHQPMGCVVICCSAGRTLSANRRMLRSATSMGMLP